MERNNQNKSSIIGEFTDCSEIDWKIISIWFNATYCCNCAVNMKRSQRYIRLFSLFYHFLIENFKSINLPLANNNKYSCDSAVEAICLTIFRDFRFYFADLLSVSTNKICEFPKLRPTQQPICHLSNGILETIFFAIFCDHFCIKRRTRKNRIRKTPYRLHSHKPSFDTKFGSHDF